MSRDDDEITPIEIPLEGPIDERRRRRSSGAATDSSELLLQQLRAVDGLHIPERGPAFLEAKGAVTKMVHTMHERGKRASAVEIAQLEKDLASERERREACNAVTARLKQAILRAARGDITLRELAEEALRPQTNPPGSAA